MNKLNISNERKLTEIKKLISNYESRIDSIIDNNDYNMREEWLMLLKLVGDIKHEVFIKL